MTQLLEQAVAELRKLPADAQDELAAIILSELADDARWDEKFTATDSPLAQLVERARTQIAEGQVKTLGMDEL